MRILQTPIFLAILLLFSVLYVDQSFAHGNDHQASNEVFDTLPSHASTEAEHSHSTAKNETSDHSHHQGDAACKLGCCAGICAACCVAIPDASSKLRSFNVSSIGQIWRLYETPDDALSLPDTPPPRV